PTDISEDLLKAAQEQGLITRYRVENAERLTFPDHAFDFVFCKESFHHFPRPMLALYEMLRVSTKGVILIEPNDRSRSVLRRAKAALNAVLGRRAHMDALSYEEDGNYIFSISRREIEKVALGLNMPQVAFKGFNDFYCPGVEFAAIDSPPGKKDAPAHRPQGHVVQDGTGSAGPVDGVPFPLPPGRGLESRDDGPGLARHRP